METRSYPRNAGRSKYHRKELAPRGRRKTAPGETRSRFGTGGARPCLPKRVGYGILFQRTGPKNAIAIDGLERVVSMCPYLNCFIYDRPRRLKGDVAVRRKNLWKFPEYATDKFHGSRHKPKFIASPRANPALPKRIGSLNTSIAEKTFPWSLGYARCMNELHPARRKFAVLLYAQMHNDLLEQGQSGRLNPYSHDGQRAFPTADDCDVGAPIKRLG